MSFYKESHPFGPEHHKHAETIKSLKNPNRWFLQKIHAVENNLIFIVESRKRVRFEILPSTKDLFHRKVKSLHSSL